MSYLSINIGAIPNSFAASRFDSLKHNSNSHSFIYYINKKDF